MAIPDFQTIFRPLLEAYAAGDERPISEVRQELARRFDLTEDEQCRTGGAWGNRHVHLEDGTVLAEDASGSWYYDPVTGDVDIALYVSPGWMRKRGRSFG